MNKTDQSQLLTRIYQIMVFNSILNCSLIANVPYFSSFTRFVMLSLLFWGSLMHFMKNKGTNVKLIVGVLILIAVSLIVMKESNSRYTIIILLFLMIVYRDVEPRQFCKKYVEAACAAMLVVFFLLIVGILPNEYRTEYRHGLSSIGMLKYRYNLGFINSTVSANFAFHISLAYMFYKQDMFRLKDALLIFVPTTILYILTDTKAAYFELLLAILIFTFLKVIKRDWFKKAIGFFSIWLMPLGACAEIYIANDFTTSNPVYVIIDEAMTYRMSWGARALKTYPIGLFGNNITWAANGYDETSQLVDMFYLRCAIQYGIVFLCLIIIGFMGISAFLKSKENYYGCVIILILSLHSITDPQLLEYACVPLLIMLLTGYKYVFANRKQRKNGNNQMESNQSISNGQPFYKPESGL